MGKVQAHKRAEKAKRQKTFDYQHKDVPADCFAIEGVVDECLPNTMFRVQVKTCEDVPQMLDRVLTATLAGKMRLYRIRVLPGDQVRGYVSKYDLTKAKITYRSTKTPSQSN